MANVTRRFSDTTRRLLGHWLLVTWDWSLDAYLEFGTGHLLGDLILDS